MEHCLQILYKYIYINTYHDKLVIDNLINNKILKRKIFFLFSKIYILNYTTPNYEDSCLALVFAVTLLLDLETRNI